MNLISPSLFHFLDKGLYPHLCEGFNSPMSHNISDHLSKLHRHTIITASPEAVVNMRIKAIRRVLKKQYVDIFFFYLLTVLGLALDLESLALSCLGPAKLQQAREKVERLDWDPSTHSISLSLFSI